jgi:transcriptional regulator with XRE-family HTH domain
MKPTSVHRPEHTALIAILKDHRLKAGLTQAMVASSLGISQTGISDIEMGSRGVDFLVVRDLCRLYQISMEDLLVELDKRLEDERTEPAPRIKRKDKKRN